MKAPAAWHAGALMSVRRWSMAWQLLASTCAVLGALGSGHSLILAPVGLARNCRTVLRPSGVLGTGSGEDPRGDPLAILTRGAELLPSWSTLRAIHLVRGICGGVEHAWTASSNNGYSMLPSKLRALGRHAPSPEGAVHPHSINAKFDALVHCLLPRLRSRGDHHPVHSAGNRIQVAVTSVTLAFFGIGIDGEHLISPVTKTLVDDVAAVILGKSRYSRHCDPSMGQATRLSWADESPESACSEASPVRAGPRRG